MDRYTISDNAFNAYNIIYYPLYGMNSLTDSKEVNAAPSDNNWARAIAINENLNTLGYTLDDEGIASFAAAFSDISQRLPHATQELLLFAATMDPARDVASLLPDAGKYAPMYPDFPRQVANMDESELRRDQLRHYASTYGVELLANILLGADIAISEGWMPEVQSTDKAREDESLLDKKVLKVVLSTDKMSDILNMELSRPARMPHSAIELLSDEIIRNPGLVLVAPKFHENALSIMIAAANADDSHAIYNTLSRMAQNPSDILKTILAIIDDPNGKRHLATVQKKAFCKALEDYDSGLLARNIADLARRGQKAVNALSTARFAGKRLLYAKELADNKQIRSWNSDIERTWRQIFEAESAETVDEEYLRQCRSSLLHSYSQRPGIMLRSLRRLLLNGFTVDELYSRMEDLAWSLSSATLVSLATNISEQVFVAPKRMDFCGSTSNDNAPKNDRSKDPEVLALVRKLLVRKFSSIETPLFKKKVYLEPGAFSMVGSIIAPNEHGTTDVAYPPCGMAYDVPEDKTVRFFTFWNDEADRTDVDLHFKYLKRDGAIDSIGWDARYNRNGMVYSGDITTSRNSAEYIDIDMRKALESNILMVSQYAHIYCGHDNWCDIPECFSGALVVSDTAEDVALYKGDNVLFADNMESNGRTLTYALIDVENHFVRLLRGNKQERNAFRKYAYTLSDFLDDLLASQKAEKVDNEEDCDIVLNIGRVAKNANGKESVCLIDEKFFIE